MLGFIITMVKFFAWIPASEKGFQILEGRAPSRPTNNGTTRSSSLQGRKSMSVADKVISQCRKPAGLFGRLVVWDMNRHHSKLTDWGLSHVSIKKMDRILDIGCGGGRTINKLAAMATA